MLSRLLLWAVNDHNEAVYLSKLDRWEKPGCAVRTCCRYQSLVLYLLVQRGSSLVIPVSLPSGKIREEGRVLKVS